MDLLQHSIIEYCDFKKWHSDTVVSGMISKLLETRVCRNGQQCGTPGSVQGYGQGMEGTMLIEKTLCETDF